MQPLFLFQNCDKLSETLVVYSGSLSSLNRPGLFLKLTYRKVRYHHELGNHNIYHDIHDEHFVHRVSGINECAITHT
jgi:hypothetical protein